MLSSVARELKASGGYEGVLSRGKGGQKHEGCMWPQRGMGPFMPVGDRKEGKRKGQREGWSQDEGTCAAEDALKSGTGQDQKRM